MDLKNINLVDHGKTLTTRDLGREIRLIITKYLESGEGIILNLEGVELFSSGFADELFGKLSATYDSNLLREKLKVIYPKSEKSSSLLRILIRKAVLDRRKKKEKEEEGDAS